MKKSLWLLLLVSQKAFSQPSLTEVFAAEKSFAAHSVAHGTKDAFLTYLDSTGVVFENGKPVNGIKRWSSQDKRPGVLNWQPIFGGVAASGDLGFTTGPWTFQPKTIADSVVARGQYATVWKKNKEGDWKFIVDLGVGKTPSFDDLVYTFSDKPLKFIKGTWNNLLNREQKFAQSTNEATAPERVAAYKQALSTQAFFLNRNGRLPVKYLSELDEAINKLPVKISYTIDGSGISNAGDLGYVYGTTVINGKTDNYLRIWRREGKEWKLVLEVLSY